MVSGEPDSGRQRDYGRDTGDDPEQAEPFAAPFGRQQLGGERAGDHAAQAEAEPAHQAAAASPARMIISTGFAQGINLVLRALARQGGVTCVAFEDPGYGSAQADETVRGALAMGIRVTYLPVDGQGLVAGELAASGAQAVVVTPAHQSPTGVVLSPARRQALTDWARRSGGYVIEDDYDSEFRYDKEPVGALQGLAPDQVFLLGTASKALAPAVRLGWVHAPSHLAAAVAAKRR